MLLLDRRRFSILLLLLVSASSLKSIAAAFGLNVRTLNNWYRVELWLVALFFFLFSFLFDHLFYIVRTLACATTFARIEAFAFNPFAKKEHFLLWAMSSYILHLCFFYSSFDYRISGLTDLDKQKKSFITSHPW